MKYVIGFIAGSAIATSILLAVNPMDMRKMRRRCKSAKKMIKGFM